MSRLEALLNNALRPIFESENSNPKDPFSPGYDRQYVEDMLFSTIGPLTDNPRWVKGEWKGEGQPPQGYTPGGQAPKWTPEEVVYAFAGNPEKLFQGGADSPGYGRMGGAPLFRLAKQVARKFRKDKDKSFIEDLYSNGFVPLTRMMKPGFDEGKSAFIPYVMRTVQGAIENGPGASSEALAATSDDRATKQLGLNAALKVTDPNVIRQAAEVVKGKYQTQKSYDKSPDNPYGHYSSDYYRTMMNYAEALETGDSDRIESAQSQIRQLISSIDDVNQSIRGASSGLGQAISNKDRGAVSGDAVNLRIARSQIDQQLKELNGTARGPVTPIAAKLKRVTDAHKALSKNLATLSKQKPEAMEYEDQKRLENLKLYNDLMSTATAALQSQNPAELRKAHEELSQAMKASQDAKRFGVASLDAKAGGDDEGSDLKSSIPGEKTGAGEKQMNEEVINYLLDLAINYDLNSLLSKDSKYRAMVAADAKNGEVGGKMTVNEFRYIIRTLGPIASNYPGKDKPRRNTAKPRDAVGWWAPGEDPEIEPLPSGEGLWNSIWKRGGYQSMGPTEISNEITQEVDEFSSLGIKTARAVKTSEKGERSVASKVAVSNTIRSAKVKLMILKEIHKSELGLDESIGNNLPPNLFTDEIDRKIIVEHVDSMIEKIDNVLFEDAPKGWKGTIEAMKKKHPDKFSTKDKNKLNPYAIANSMKNKGAKPHYKDQKGKPVKKK